MEHLAIVGRRWRHAAAARGGGRGARSRRLAAAMGRRWQEHLRDRDGRHVRLRRAHSGRRGQRGADHRQADRARPASQRGRVRGGDLGRRQPSQRGLFRRGRRRQTEVPAAHASERRALRGAAARDDRGGQREEQGRHRSPRPADEAGRLRQPARRFRCCCGFTAGRTARISTRSRSSVSGSRRTATRCSR